MNGKDKNKVGETTTELIRFMKAVENPPWMIDLVEQLAKYYDAEQKGLIFITPCKVGDTVYQLDEDCEDGIYETKVLSFTLFENGLAMRTISSFPSVADWGVTVFPSRELAEKARDSK